MKCVCGYVYSRDWNFDTSAEDNIGDEKFDEILGSFHIREKFEYNDRSVYLYACPKCGTIHMSK